MSILDWLELYREWINSHEPIVRLYMELGITNDTTEEYAKYKSGYEALLIECQSMEASAIA